ncbi:hypothetical protein KORDIASMS9_02816 [Kordia sp. SMS9]|uniref:hypothetical protein n=1 Tax=Kordia sp. SMS9 TaxID=2282170 RepID=UPI000E0D766D|nr:hypothetical protein [Kordia sp. SMS9]AXG70576.1 hypothetical protein KORDIASMS9_02816 [Kordia sp. SMS9]
MEDIKVSEEYKEAFNEGYELAKELGLKPDILDGLKAGKYRMQAMSEGMKEYQKDIAMEQSKDVIPPFDMDSVDNTSYIDTNIEDSKTQDKGIEPDK